MTSPEGVLTAMVTPFTASGDVDEPGARRLARDLIENGSHGVVVAGSTGESATLDDREHISLLAAVVEEIGAQATVICGTGTNDTRHSIELTKAAEAAGADAALVVTPYYNKPTPDGIQAHFEAIAAAVPALPIVAYNIPSRVVVNVPPADLARLGEIESVVAVKQANNDDLEPIEGLALLAGNDDIFLATLEMGGAGGILVASQVVGPRMREIWEAVKAGEMERARQVDAGLRSVYEAMGVVTNPIPVKAALEMTGAIESGTLRLPMTAADPATRAAVRAALEGAGVSLVAA